MKVLIQRVTHGEVRVAGEIVGAIGSGFVALVGVRTEDTEADARALALKTVALRILADADGRMNRSLADTGGAVLAISQFTLYADTRKGNRPSFIRAAAPAEAERLYECYLAALREGLGPDRVACGRFGASMQVVIHNDGPVTVELNTDAD